MPFPSFQNITLRKTLAECPDQVLKVPTFLTPRLGFELFPKHLVGTNLGTKCKIVGLTVSLS